MSFATLYLLVRATHLIAAAVWVGGMITLAVLVVGLRRSGAPRETLQAAARAFAHLSWTAMAVSVLTGLAQIELLHVSWAYPNLHLKLGLVTASIVVALLHQVFAKRLSARVRGMTNAILLVLAVAIIAAAVRL